MVPAPVALLWLALAGPGRAAERDAKTGNVPAAADGAPNEKARLEEAVAEYQSGRWDAAQLALTLLISDTSVSQAVQQEARIYLGEVVYTRGDEEGARKIFEQVLTIDPDFQVDPFRHPPEILTQFEIARSSVAPFPRPDEFRPKFGATFVPFGSYQLGHGKPVRGATLLVTQAALGAVSFTMFVGLYGEDARTYEVGSPKEDRVKTQRAVQVATAVGFWSSVVYGWLDAQHLWRTERAAQGFASDVPIGFTISGRL